MSHQLDAPPSRGDPRLDLTDLYVFDGVEGTVLVMALDRSVAGPGRAPGFHPQARYEFRVHLGGEPTERLVYRVSFTGRGTDGSAQVWRLDRVRGAEARDDGSDGTVVATGPNEGAAEGREGIRAWTGTTADPFFLDLGLWGHVVDAAQQRRPPDLADWHAGRARNSFAGSQVAVIVVEVPYATDSDLPASHPIGVWARTLLATDAGGWSQVDRVGVPLVWPLLGALDDDDRQRHGPAARSHPIDDARRDARPFARMIAALVRHSGVGDPDTYARTVLKRLLPDVLPYTVATPAAFSFAGFNGRRLSDNAAEVMLALVTNSALPTGLPAPADRRAWQDSFPYVVPAPP